MRSYLSNQEEETDWGRSFQSGVDSVEEETRWVTMWLSGVPAALGDTWSTAWTVGAPS